MIQAGKKSAAKLATVATMPGQRAAPPRNLSEAEARVWRATVATKPADWFQPDSWPMLTLYCRAVVMADHLAERIDAGLDTFTVGELSALLTMRDREGKAVNTYARAMRLTQQARLKAETAATAHTRANGSSGGAPKPWEVAG
jgi:hypothetical protein